MAPEGRSGDPAVSEGLDALIARCVARNPEDRPQDGRGLQDALLSPS